MAIVKFGATVVGVRGTIAGLTFSHNASSNYVRAWTRSSNPRTASQSVARGQLGSLAIEWRDLTSTQRSGWDYYAGQSAQALTNSLGETYYASGFNWFCRINCQRFRAGWALRTTYPSLSQPSVVSSVLFYFGESGGTPYCKVAYGSGEFAATDALVIKGSLTRRSARSVQYGTYYELVCETDPGGTEYDFYDEVEERWGAPQEDDVLFIELQRQGTEGRRSIVQSLNEGYIVT